MKSIDLHGVKHKEVLKTLDNYFANLGPYDQELTIIIGNSELMRDVVSATIEEYGFEYHVGGILETNPAVITVYFD